jgi:hypothetical protein
MKNFPNQFNDPQKFREALEAIEGLRDSGDASDDGELGAELARRGIYGLSGTGTLAQRLKAERSKKPSNQGTRTAAREMRRTLIALGLLDSSLSISPSGRALLAAAPESSEERAIWRHALVGLQLGEGRSVSHPVLVLLSLVEAREIHHRDGMELALEARDDSAHELKRLLSLIDQPSEERRATLGVSKTTQDNARKIFPRLAEHAGLIERGSRSDPWLLTELGRNALASAIGGAAAPPPPQKRSAAGRRAAFRSAKRSLGRGPVKRSPAPPKPPRAPRSQPTPEEQAAADQLLYERTTRHEALVDCVLSRLPSKSASWEDGRSYDLVVDLGPGPLLLFEMKTLELDEATQVRRAIGQLIFYEGVVLAREWPARKVQKIAAFESPLPDYLADLLEANAIAAIWCDAAGLHPLNSRGKRVAGQLG